MYYKNEYKNRFRILKGGLISLVVASNLYGAPTGGTVVSGTATINQSGNTTNINQSSNKAIINWQDFSIKSNETVNFNQPNVNSITLNRVIGNEKSIIDGALNANGQVWLINSNGVLFGKNAKVNTAGIVASTKDISNEDFNKGNYNFKGDSKASILNEGEIKSLANTHATFIANSVTNKGKIEVHKGTINLVGASDVTLTLNENQNISLKVNKGVVDALVDNQNLIVANGGQIYLTTNAKNELLKGVVNHSGIIEANSLDDLTNNQNEVILFAHGGTTNVDGSIIAKNSFVETSGDKVKVADDFKVSADKWLIDPTDFTIASSGGDMSGTALSNNLANTSVEIQSTTGTINTNGNGDIFVNDEVSWSTANTLTLNAQNNIYINKSITATNNGKLALKYGQASSDGGTSDYYVNAKVNLKAGQNFSTQKGSNVANNKNYQVITALGSATSSNDGTLQGINANLNGNYVLGSNIDAGATKTNTANWGTIGFNPLGDWSNSFKGMFDGLGHTISDLYINRNSTKYVGLFGYINNSSTVKNIGLTNVDITGNLYVGYVGGLAGENNGLIQNSYSSGSVNGNEQVGGLVGRNWGGGRVQNSYASGSVTGFNEVGGLVGRSEGSTIENSYSNGSVNGHDLLGGLVGLNYNGTITNSYASGSVTGFNEVGGLVGRSEGSTIENSYSNGSVTGFNEVGGLVGRSEGSTIENSYASGTVGGDSYVGGLVGLNYNGTITNSYASGSVTGFNEVGGLVGVNGNGAISNSYASGNVIAQYYLVGGLVGLNHNGTITNSYASGSVNGNYDVGGLVGYNHGTISDSFYDKETNTASMNDSSYGKTKAEILSLFSNLTGWGTNGAGASVEGYEIVLLPYLIGVTKDEDKSKSILFSGGYGTVDNPYTITNWTQLQNINNSNILTQNYYFNLLNNLSSSTSDYTNLASNTANSVTGWNPIGNDTNHFTGTFDGLGFTISNLYINRPTENHVGLFGYTNNATIKNIGVVDFGIYALGYSGGLAGSAHNNTQISNSYSTGGIYASNDFGGLIGHLYNSSSIGYSYSLANINKREGSSGLLRAGGLVGTVQNSSSVKNSYSIGNITGGNSNDNEVGGLIGYFQNSSVLNSYSSRNINASGTPEIAGLIGKNNAGTASNSFYDKTKFNGNGVGYGNQNGVTGKTTQEMSYGGIFKNSSWDIVADSSVTSLTPVIKWDSANNKYVWAISPIALTYTLSDKTTTYDGTTQTLSSFYTSNPFTIPTGYEFLNLTSADYKFQVDGADVTGYKDVGTYSNIKVALNGTSATDEFLTISSSGNTDGNLVINKANLDIVANSNSLVYNGQTQSVNGYSFGTNKLLGSDTEADLTLSGTTTSGKNAGSYATNLGGTSNNYNINFTQGNLSISKADLTATLNDNSKTYDGTSYSGGNGITYNGFVNGETASLLNGTLNYSGTSQGAKDAGNYIISGSGLTSNNYNISFVDGKLTINKKDLTISNITANNKTYDGTTTATLSNIGTLDGLVTGEDLVLNNPTSVIFSSKDVADGITVTASGYTIADKDSFKASNYNLTHTSKTTTANISKADLTATLNDNSKTYDGTSYSGGNGITFNGFVNGETASLLGGNLVYSGTSQGAKDAGNYIISGSGLTSNNYNISFVDGKLTINKKDLTISAITANNKTYDGTTTATLSNIGTLVGLVKGENLTLSNTSVVFSDKNVADGIVVTATGYTIADKDSFKASNYNLLDTSKTTTANIVASVNPTPTVDEKVQRVIASIEPSTNSNSSSNQSVPNSLNSNIRTLSFNGVDETRVINGGVKMPENIANEEDIIK